MSEQIIYHFSRNRQHQAEILRNIALCCLTYIGGLIVLWYLAELPVSSGFVIISSSILAAIAALFTALIVWLKLHPAKFEICLTQQNFSLYYPDDPQRSFCVPVKHIRCFEYRRNMSPKGPGLLHKGLVTLDGKFYELSTHYGCSLREVVQAVQQINPAVTLEKSVNIQMPAALRSLQQHTGRKKAV